MARSMTMIEGFWDRFEECILETGETKVAIAKKIGCDRKVFINKWDGSQPNTIYVARFCSQYGFSSDYLFGISKEKYSRAKPAKVEEFWKRFDECTTETGDSKVKIAKRIGCDRKTLYTPREKERIPTSLYIARFCAIYKYSSDYLFGTSKNKCRVA